MRKNNQIAINILEDGNVEHQIGKCVYIVTPVYNENHKKTVHEILLKLMLKNAESH